MATNEQQLVNTVICKIWVNYPVTVEIFCL